MTRLIGCTSVILLLFQAISQDSFGLMIGNPPESQESIQKSKRVTIKMRDADLHDIFRLIAEASRLNVVVDSRVQGKITLTLEDVPWKVALDLILDTHGLVSDRRGNIIRILKIADYVQEQNLKREYRNSVIRNTPVGPDVKVIRVN